VRAVAEKRRPRPRIKGGVKLIFELTNLCNFSCIHCIRDEEGAKRFLDPELIRKILQEVEPYEMVDAVALTGGEPTIHPQFADIVALIAEFGYGFNFVTNGWGFGKTLESLQPVREFVRAVSFSLDGARLDTHDRIRRRPGSFRQVMQAAARCRFEGLQTRINMTVTRENVEELEEMALLASRLGCTAVGYAHCQPTPDALRADLVMNARERLQVEADVASLNEVFQINLLIAGDHHASTAFAQCPQLQMKEFNIDYRGFLTACCTLSNYRGGAEDTDVVADLNDTSFFDAHVALMDTIRTVNFERIHAIRDGKAGPAEKFLCAHCLKRYSKVSDLDAILYPSPPKGHVDE
jgi:MoaA/NifB/PqqE/SkfB family radical SAM enzyme